MSLQEVVAWLHTWPGWEAGVQIELLPQGREGGGLFPQGYRELECREDVVGNRVIRGQWQLLLRLVLPGPGPQAAELLVALQNWVRQEDARLQDRRCRLEQGRLADATQPGLGIYQALLTMEFTTIYKEKEYGEN